MGDRDRNDSPESRGGGYDGPHEHDERRNDPGGTEGGADIHNDSEPSADAGASAASQRSEHGEVGGSERSDRTPRHEVETADEAIEGEVLDSPGSKRVHAVVSQWSGELPHPDDAERYEAIEPGTFDRLISLNERRLSIVEKDQELAATRESTIRTAVQAEADVKRGLAKADTDALKRGQWMSWSISAGAVVVAAGGLLLGQAAALALIIVPVVQVGAQLVRTVTRDRNGSTEQPTDEKSVAEQVE